MDKRAGRPMGRPLTWLDLCSGLGGASQPAKDRGWRVIRVDMEPAFKPDIICNLLDRDQRGTLVRTLAGMHIDVAWASPICTEFTKASLPATWAANRLYPARPDAALSIECWDIIRQADWHVLENVLGARKYLTPILGPVRAIVAGHVFWGNLPCLLPQTSGHKWRLPPSPERAAIRAKVPYEIGEAICVAVERLHGDINAEA